MGYKMKIILIVLVIYLLFVMGSIFSINDLSDISASERNSIETEHSEHDHTDEHDLYEEEHSNVRDHDNDVHDETEDHLSEDFDHDHDENDHVDETASQIDSNDHDEDGHVEDIIKLTEAQSREINLTLEKARSGNLYNEISLMGETRLNQDLVAYVIPKMQGIVHEVRVSLGDTVKAGQILAVIESIELAEAKADYLEKYRKFEITKKAYKRKKYLHEEKIASEASLLEKEAEFLNAETSLKAARSMLIVSGLSLKDIKEISNTADQRFGHYEIKSPISGIVIDKHINIGEKLNNDSEIFTVSDLSKLWVDLSIPARDIYRIKQGDDVTIESSNGIKTTGEISLVGPVVNENTRTALARVILDNSNGKWKPGLFITGHIPIAVENLPIVVPGEAVQNMEGEDVIFIKDGDVYEPVVVSTGRRDRKRVEIIAGLKEGMIYVTEGAFELKSIMVTSGMDSHAGHGH